MKSIVRNAVRRLGFEITRVNHDRWRYDATMESAIRRCAARLQPRSIIDVGASDGRWSQAAMKWMPRAEYLLIEAQAEPHEEKLKSLASSCAGVRFVIAAAGPYEGIINFEAGDPWGGAASEAAFAQNNIRVPVTTIDSQVAAHQMLPPFLIKLDTHGYEIPILQGADKTLANTDILVIEAYNFKLRDGAARFWELCSYLESRGFRPVDICDVHFRSKDNFLWQLDLFFARSARPEFSDNSYR